MSAVKNFFSTDPGAPTCTGEAGSMVALLYAILSTGYNSKTVTLAQTAGVATGTCSNHNFRVGQVLLISGATPTAYNGEFTVLTVPTTSTFTFAIASGTASPATGTITAIVAAANWTRAFTAANKAVWQSAEVGASQLPLQVLDANAQYSTVTGFISMSDVDTGTESWHAGYWKKSSSSDNVQRPWVAVADGKTLHLFIGWNQIVGSTPMYSHYVFGDLASYVTSDAYAAMLCAHSASGPATLGTDVGTLAACNIGSTLSTSVGVKVARALTGAASSARYLRAISAAGGLSAGNFASGADANSPAAQPADNSLGFVPVLLCEYDSALTKYMRRGDSRGHYHVTEYLQPVGVNGFTLYTGLTGLTGRSMLMVKTGAGATPTECREAIDITGPWA